ILGLGWSLLGIDYVQRQTDKGLPKYDADDTFITVGGEELVPLLDDGSFRAENEGGFARYRPLDDARRSWTCEKRDGVRRTLGVGDASRIEDQGRTFRSYMTRVEDTNGNTVEYEYAKASDGSTRMVYPSRIVYGGSTTGPVAGRHIILFIYEKAARP